MSGGAEDGDSLRLGTLAQLARLGDLLPALALGLDHAAVVAQRQLDLVLRWEAGLQLAPSLELGAGMAYVAAELAAVGTAIEIDVRGKLRPARVASKPLYKGRS